MQKKTNFGPDFDPFGPDLATNFFLQALTLLVLRYCSKLSSNAIIKANWWRKLEKIKKKTNFGHNFGLFDQQADEETDESDFIRCCPIYKSNTEKIND